GATGEDPSRSSPGGPVPMLIPATQLRVGMIVQHQNDLWRVMNVVHVTPGNWRGMVQTKLRNLRSGTQTEYRFRSEDKAERVTFEQHEMEYLYESDRHQRPQARHHRDRPGGAGAELHRCRGRDPGRHGDRRVRLARQGRVAR